MRQSSIIIHKGGKEAKYEIYVEDYVISFLKGETGTLKLSEFYFYGYREKDGRRYVIYGAGRDKRLSVFDKYSLLEEIGCRLTQAGPVFLVREENDIYEVKGYDIFYQDNGEMQSYLIDQKSERDGKERASRIETSGSGVRTSGRVHAGGCVHIDRNADTGKGTYEQRNKPAPHSAISLQLGIILVALVAIVINSANSYDKMQQLDRSASEVFFAIENQEAGDMAKPDVERDEIKVERDITQEDDMQEELLKERAESDAGQEEEILKLVTLENEGHAGDSDEEADAQEMTEDAAASTEEASEDAVGDAQQESSAESTEQEESGDESTDEEEVEALSRNVARYYKVERGDTLYMISKKVYGDTSHVKKICEVNNITDPDNIRYGQKIILP